MKKWLAFGLSVILITVDQVIKLWALRELAPLRQIEIIPKLLYLTYVENRGAAFGILQDKTHFLSIVSGAVLIVVLFALLTGRFKTEFLIWTVSVGVAGGMGNLIDRVSRGFVVDYLDFSALFGFPVFNFADCCVVCATFLILIYVIRLERIEKKNSLAPSKEKEA